MKQTTRVESVLKEESQNDEKCRITPPNMEKEIDTSRTSSEHHASRRKLVKSMNGDLQENESNATLKNILQLENLAAKYRSELRSLQHQMKTEAVESFKLEILLRKACAKALQENTILQDKINSYKTFVTWNSDYLNMRRQYLEKNLNQLMKLSTSDTSCYQFNKTWKLFLEEKNKHLDRLLVSQDNLDRILESLSHSSTENISEN